MCGQEQVLRTGLCSEMDSKEKRWSRVWEGANITPIHNSLKPHPFLTQEQLQNWPEAFAEQWCYQQPESVFITATSLIFYLFFFFKVLDLLKTCHHDKHCVRGATLLCPQTLLRKFMVDARFDQDVHCYHMFLTQKIKTSTNKTLLIIESKWRSR